MINLIQKEATFLINQIGKKDVTEIFVKSENQETQTEYSYAEQKGIIGKPSLTYSGEGLRKYSLQMKLHYSYCNPTRILNGLKEKAKNHEIISYWQAEEYIGEFVIQKIEEKIITRFANNILYAEIVVDLLENPVEDEDFSPKTNPNKTFFDDLKDDTEKKIVEPVKAKVGALNNDMANKITEASLNFALCQANSHIGSASGGLL